MNFETARAYCLSRKGATEDLPFGPDTLVFRVRGKMFGLVNLNGPPFRINLKCDPERALELRATYEAVQPGYHMNKKHWNTVQLGDDLPSDELRGLIDHSYALVVDGLKQADRDALDRL